jgi:hypothetical protein
VPPVDPSSTTIQASGREVCSTKHLQIFRLVPGRRRRGAPERVEAGYIVSDGSGVSSPGLAPGLSARRERVMLVVPILATICVVAYAIV